MKKNVTWAIVWAIVDVAFAAYSVRSAARAYRCWKQNGGREDAV